MGVSFYPSLPHLNLPKCCSSNVWVDRMSWAVKLLGGLAKLLHRPNKCFNSLFRSGVHVGRVEIPLHLSGDRVAPPAMNRPIRPGLSRASAWCYGHRIMRQGWGGCSPSFLKPAALSYSLVCFCYPAQFDSELSGFARSFPVLCCCTQENPRHVQCDASPALECH